MIRPIPNPPMNSDDVARFRQAVAKHICDEYTDEERQQMKQRRDTAIANARRIIANCGGKKPLLGYWR